jgi:hypothetical protein
MTIKQEGTMQNQRVSINIPFAHYADVLSRGIDSFERWRKEMFPF